jgi:hypothetical protein
MAEKRKRGRPPGGEYAGKSEVVHIRLRPDTKAALERAARASGRTVSQETEHRLLRGLNDFGKEPTGALLEIAGTAIGKALDLKGTQTRWWEDPRAFEQAANVIDAVLDMFRPQGASPRAADRPFTSDARQLAILSVENTLRAVQIVDPTKPYARQTKHERWANMLRKDLGPLADVPAIWGETAEQARARYEKLAPILSEYIPLTQKLGVAELDFPERERIAMSPLTKQERERYLELRRQIDALRRES